MNLRLLLFLFCVSPIVCMYGQEQLGLSLNHLSGIQAMRLNPAAPAVTPYRWEVNIAGGSLFASNNYLYLRNARTADLLNSSLTQNILFAPDLSNPETLPPGRLVVDFQNDNRRRFAYIAAKVAGPSFYYKIDRYNSIGLTTGARVLASASGVDNDLSYYQFNEFRANDTIGISPFQGGGLAFSEIGLNYTMSSPAPGGNFSLGITAKFLQGYGGLFLSSRSQFNIARTPENGIRGSSARLKYGFTDNLTDEDYQAEVIGSGIGIDIGMVATVDGSTPGEYIWKVGFSIVDIGEIRFKNSAQRHNIRMSGNEVTLSPDNYENLDNLDELAQAFSFDALGDSLGTRQDNSISVGLPSAVSIQIDHAITSNIFIGGVFHQFLPLGIDGIRRGSLLAISPRFEQKWVSMSLPVSMYNWQQIRFGAALRLGPLSIGTDHIGSFMNRGELYGTDFYAALSIFPFGRKGRKGGNNVPCYSF
ncbi:MAG: hypothetical protein KTR30_36580 [Saprospiraceae bacterium]|nr:hypothetical protein [Saprospiraceae bacterium]